MLVEQFELLNESILLRGIKDRKGGAPSMSTNQDAQGGQLRHTFQKRAHTMLHHKLAIAFAI
jgi:hypothetical protein